MPRLDANHPVVASLTGVLDLFRVRRDVPPLAPDERLDGRVALVTGGASGLGFATTVDLARRGAKVFLADRDDPAAAARRARARGAPEGLVEPLRVDLSDLDSVDALVAELAARGVRLDRLVLNAAIVPTSARTTPQGLDEMFVVNYLSSFALVTRALETGVLPVDRAQPLAGPPGGSRNGRGGDPGGIPRVVVVASESHRWSAGFDADRLDAPRDGSPRRVLDGYGAYKLMLATFAWELSRRLAPGGVPRVAVHALCPGAMRTRIARELPAPLRAAVDLLMRVAFQDPFVADEPVLHLACSRSIEGRTALYLHRMAAKDVDPRAADPEAGRVLWERTEALLARVRGR